MVKIDNHFTKMIDKLNIENFMLFEKLEIPTLKRINLIGGKNNAGKTALLEAIRLIASKGNPGVINSILLNRQQWINRGQAIYDGLFERKKILEGEDILLKINDLIIVRRQNEISEWEYGGEIQVGNNGLNKVYKFNLSSHTINLPPEDKSIFLPSSANHNLIINLWEKIVLTPKEGDIINIIRETVEPNLVRLDVGQNMVRIKLKNSPNPMPLATLGDGVYRILLIALGLANAQNSILLIDEIELGLHHSILEKLWRMIFKYARIWNIQVFITTHSQDAIRTFSYSMDEEESKEEAQFIRLQIGRMGKNEAILFDQERLSRMINLALEIR